MESHLAALPRHSGARLLHDDELGLVLIEGQHPGASFGYGAVVRWPDEGWSERLARFEHRQRDAGEWPSLVLAEGLTRPHDLAGRLAALGWTSIAKETVLWTRHPAVVPHLDPMLRLEAVTDRTAPEHESVERRIFGLAASGVDERIAGIRAGLADGSLRVYLARSQGEAVAVARLSLADGVAGLYGVGVVPERRRHGLGTLVTTVATRAGLASGRPLVWLSVEDDNKAARGMYEGLGFETGFSWQRWLALAGQA